MKSLTLFCLSLAGLTQALTLAPSPPPIHYSSSSPSILTTRQQPCDNGLPTINGYCTILEPYQVDNSTSLSNIIWIHLNGTEPGVNIQAGDCANGYEMVDGFCPYVDCPAGALNGLSDEQADEVEANYGYCAFCAPNTAEGGSQGSGVQTPARNPMPPPTESSFRQCRYKCEDSRGWSFRPCGPPAPTEIWHIPRDIESSTTLVERDYIPPAESSFRMCRYFNEDSKRWAFRPCHDKREAETDLSARDYIQPTEFSFRMCRYFNKDSKRWAFRPCHDKREVFETDLAERGVLEPTDPSDGPCRYHCNEYSQEWCYGPCNHFHQWGRCGEQLLSQNTEDQLTKRSDTSSALVERGPYHHYHSCKKISDIRWICDKDIWVDNCYSDKGGGYICTEAGAPRAPDQFSDKLVKMLEKDKRASKHKEKCSIVGDSLVCYNDQNPKNVPASVLGKRGEDFTSGVGTIRVDGRLGLLVVLAGLIWGACHY